MKRFLRNLYLIFFGYFKRPSSGIHIINAHFVSPFISNENGSIVFEKFLKHLARYCKFISLQEATNLIVNRRFPEKDCMVAFTFDDGFEECYTIIAPILEKYNVRGAFFINANYIGSNEKYQRGFNNRILTFEKYPMNWDQIKDLHRRGHIIGSHTLDHLNMADLSNDEIDYQLKTNKQIIENKLNCDCEYFAWTYGQMKHFPDNALKITKKYHKFIFSATNFTKYFSMDGFVLNRRHIEPFWQKSHIYYFLSFKKNNNFFF